MKGRVVTMGILSFILMCILTFMVIYLATDGIFHRDTVYIPEARQSLTLDGPFKDAATAFSIMIWFCFGIGIANIIMGIAHLRAENEVAKEINATMGWMAIFFAPFNWIVCICALVKFARDEKNNNFPNEAEYINKKKEKAKNGSEIRAILMGAMSIIAMICLILYFVWLADVDARRFVAPVPWTPEWEMKREIIGTREEAAIAELCVGLGAWFISFIIGIVHLSKENKVEEELNRSAGYVAIFFAPVNWIICILTIARMKKQKANI